MAQAAKKGKVIVVCHRCQIQAFKFGVQNGHQRYHCRTCGKTFSDIPEKPLGELRTDESQAIRVIEMLVEGIGIRAIERLTGLNRRTVLGILQVAGEKCARFMAAHVRNVKAEQIQADEVVCFVAAKQMNVEAQDTERGEFFALPLAVARESKLIITHHTSKRTTENTQAFLQTLKNRTVPGFQLTTDGLRQYCGQDAGVAQVFGREIDYATETKCFARPGEFLPRKLIGVRRKTVFGNPDEKKTTPSATRSAQTSLCACSLRRFTRCTLGYSKKLENLRHAVALFVCHFNFIRLHSSLAGRTPAMAAGLTDHTSTVSELLTTTC